MSGLHPNYLALLYASNEISSLSSAGLKLNAMRTSPPSDKVNLTLNLTRFAS